jgi:hypothetical protein
MPRFVIFELATMRGVGRGWSGANFDLHPTVTDDTLEVER